MANRSATAGTLPVARPVTSRATEFFALMFLVTVIAGAIAWNLARPDSRVEVVPAVILTPMDDYGIRHPAGTRPVAGAVALTPMDDYGIRHPAGTRPVVDAVALTPMDDYGIRHPIGLAAD